MLFGSLLNALGRHKLSCLNYGILYFFLCYIAVNLIAESPHKYACRFCIGDPQEVLSKLRTFGNQNIVNRLYFIDVAVDFGLKNLARATTDL